MPASPPVKVRRTAIFLKYHEKQKMLQKAFDLSRQREYSSLASLARDAAEQSLEESRRPHTFPVTMDHYQWFRDGLKEMAQNPPKDREPEPEPILVPPPEPEPQPEPEPEPKPDPKPAVFASVASLGDLDPFHERRLAQSHSEPETILADDQELTDWEPAEEPERRRPATDAKDYSVSASAAIHEADEREEWAMIAGLRRRREADRELLETIVSLRQAVYGLSRLTAEVSSLGTQIGKLRDDLKIMPAAIRASTVELIRTQEAFLRTTTPHRDTATPRTQGVHVNGHLATPPPAPVIVAPPRKVKVVVVGYSSGHQTRGCEKEVAGRAVVEFATADQAMPKFEGFDFIVIPKECPKNWREKAPHYYSKDRLIIASGTAQDVGRQIARLQPPRAVTR